MSLWADYIKELYGKEMYEDSMGFCTYYIVPGTDVCYIEDIYVVPEHRKSAFGAEMESKVEAWSRLQGCSQLMGSVATGLQTTERSISVLISRGFKLSKVTETMLYFKKNI
jgi:GNAT superfamily N-acetyltransferase